MRWTMQGEEKGEGEWKQIVREEVQGLGCEGIGPIRKGKVSATPHSRSKGNDGERQRIQIGIGGKKKDIEGGFGGDRHRKKGGHRWVLQETKEKEKGQG